MLRNETARNIALAYQDIEASENLISEITEAITDIKEDISNDGEFSRRKPLCKFEFPIGKGGFRVYRIEPELGLSVLRSHLVAQKANLEKLNEIARIEINS